MFSGWRKRGAPWVLDDPRRPQAANNQNALIRLVLGVSSRKSDPISWLGDDARDEIDKKADAGGAFSAAASWMQFLSSDQCFIVQAR